MTVRRAHVLLGIVGVLAAAAASAHLTGVFAHFVKDIADPTASTRLLQQQINDVGGRIEKLGPDVRKARQDYDEQAGSALKRIRFYDVYAGSALGALWAGAQNPIDVIASTELMQRRLKEDLDALTQLSRSYEQLQGTERSLRLYSDVLVPFRDSSAARAQRLSKLPPGLVSPFAEPYIAYKIAEDWEALRAVTFVLYFQWSARRIAKYGLSNVLEDAGGGRSWRLQEDTLNAIAGGNSFPFLKNARFYLRADHVNFSGRIDSPIDAYELLTVGQFERTGPASFQYRIEAIFLDGMPIDPDDPDVQREVYQGQLLGIDLTPIMPKGTTTATFEQRNGSVEFRFQ
ncbi:MAG TPA: hypothetical protein VJQ52_24555 [Steroidobacteraceae bacterium]|nr:hypothetical protein [Steroidobacteraceae bacterium]